MFVDSLGLVTNVFRRQLDGGDSLAELVIEAYRRGIRAFELRQGALGEYECVLHGASATALSRLAEQCPEAEFNVAIELPIFAREVSQLDPVFMNAREAALALCARPRGIHEATAHLRMVDLTLGAPLLASAAFAAQLDCLDLLVNDALASGVRVSFEHALQPARVVREVIRRLGPLIETNGFVAGGNLGLCYDPCNLVNSPLEREDPIAVTAALSADEVLMFHIKQSHQGAPLPYVAEGDVDWPGVLALIAAMGYAGPTLLEIAPSDDVWGNVERSRAYVTGVIQQLPGRPAV